MFSYNKLLIILLFLLTTLSSFIFFSKDIKDIDSVEYNINKSNPTPTPTITTVSYKTPGSFYEIPKRFQVYQRFNNCGPASLSILLSYQDITISQEELGQKLRPFQNPQGINDDKSTFLSELASEAKNYNLDSFHRPNGDLTLLKTFISNDIPVVVRTWLHPNEDIGHFRLVRGFDDSTNEIIQDDSYQGPNIRYSYDEFVGMWKPFNYEYLVVVPKEKQELVKSILKNEVDEKIAWENANTKSLSELSQNPNDMYANFNLSVSYFHLGKYQESIQSFEKVESILPSRMLWYQTEPISSYLELGNYDKVFTMTSRILNNNNLAYSELYVLRGRAYQALGQTENAKQEFEKAYLYNIHSEIVTSYRT